MRLCGRSLKDAEPFDFSSVNQKYEKELQKLLDGGSPLNSNTKMIAIAHTSYLKVDKISNNQSVIISLSLKIHTAEEAMNFLLTSERAYTDMIDWINYGEPEQIVLREWQSELSYDYEFRVFINKNKITAISQYDHYAVYSHLQQEKEKIEKSIRNFWEKIHPFVGEESYVIDFGYFPETDTCIMIEISPFLPCTGPALFHWKNDKELLENGPLEFRINTRERPDIDELIQSNWVQRWATPSPKYYELFDKVEEQGKFQENSNKNFLSSLLHNAKKLVSKQEKEQEIFHYLFFYGTLKRNFHWNQKFLSQSEFIMEVTTVDVFPLVIGQCGVPYLLGDLPGQGKCVRGEVWKVNSETLLGLDEYEGITKGYYCRKTIKVVSTNGNYFIDKNLN